MANCDSLDLYKSLDFCEGQTVLPGIRKKVYFQKKSNIAEWPKLPALAEGADMGALATYTGNFTLAADKKWLSLKNMDSKSDVNCETQGEKPSVTHLNKASIFHPGTEEDAAGFCRQAAADDLVFLVQQRNGKFRVLGCEEFETTVKPATALGQGITGTAGTTLEIEAPDLCPAPFYPGKIETEDGDINGADGSAWVEGGE